MDSLHIFRYGNRLLIHTEWIPDALFLRRDSSIDLFYNLVFAEGLSDANKAADNGIRDDWTRVGSSAEVAFRGSELHLLLDRDEELSHDTYLKAIHASIWKAVFEKRIRLLPGRKRIARIR